MNSILTAPSAPTDPLFERFPDSLIWIGADGLVLQQNPAALALFGESLVDWQWSDCVERFFQPSPDDGHEISLKDGRLVSLKTTAMPSQGQLIVISDLTPSRQWQRAKAHQTRLAQLGQMSASLAHQIKTPLATAMVYAEALTEPGDPTRQRQQAQRLLTSLEGLSTQIQDLLSFSRGELELKDQVSTQGLIQHWQTEAERLLKTPIQWTCQLTDAQIRCAKTALTGAFLNLVKNAQQIARDRSIALRLVIGAREIEGKLRVTLVDNAGGLNGLTPQAVMAPFSSQRAGGTGLGLTVCDGLLKAHGGRLTLDPIPDGLSVTLEVPLI